MHWLGTSDFLALDADLDFSDARSLAEKLTPQFLVIRMELFGEDEDDELLAGVPAYFVVDTGDVSDVGETSTEWRTIGDFVRTRCTQALALDTDDGWVATRSTVEPGTDVNAVVLGDDGIVSTVVPDLSVFAVGEEHAFTQPEVIPNEVWHHVHPADDAIAAMSGLNATSSTVAADLAPGVAGAEDRDTLALEVRFPDAVQLGATVPLLVLLELGPGPPGSAPIIARPGEVLEIMASPSSGFTLIDEPAKPMTVLPEGQTLPVKFDLRADIEGKGVAKVFGFREGVCVASLTVSASISTSAVAPTSTTPATMSLPPAVKAQADLDLMVFRESYRGGQALRYRLSSADSQVTSDFGPHPLDADPSAYVHAAFEEIQALSATPRGWGAAERIRLERIGADLYESLVPSDLQEVLWQTDRVRLHQLGSCSVVTVGLGDTGAHTNHLPTPKKRLHRRRKDIGRDASTPTRQGRRCTSGTPPQSATCRCRRFPRSTASLAYSLDWSDGACPCRRNSSRPTNGGSSPSSRGTAGPATTRRAAPSMDWLLLSFEHMLTCVLEPDRAAGR